MPLYDQPTALPQSQALTKKAGGLQPDMTGNTTTTSSPGVMDRALSFEGIKKVAENDYEKGGVKGFAKRVIMGPGFGHNESRVSAWILKGDDVLEEDSFNRQPI